MDKLKKVTVVSLFAILGLLVLNTFLATAQITAAEPSTTNAVYYFEDFEDSDGGYVHSATGDGPSSWEWGTPNYTNAILPVFSLTSAHSGLKAWGTNLDSEYDNGISQTLTSPIIDVSTVPDNTDIILTWQQAWHIEPEFDLGYTEVSLDGAMWVRIDAGFDGQSEGWEARAVDVSSAESTVQVRWSLVSDDIGNFGGLYIDDVTLRTPGSNIMLQTTVGRDPNTCGTEQTLTIPTAGETVYYCYTVTNIGDLDLSLHNLKDSQFGNVFIGESYNLTSTYQLTTAVVITDHTESTATWTAYNEGSADSTTASSTTAVYVFVSGEHSVETQLTNEVVTTSLTLSNTTDSLLEWTVFASNDLSAEAKATTPLPTALLYNNGTFINGLGTGAGSTDESIVQNDSLGMVDSGFNHAVPLRIADEFTIPNTTNGWSLGTVTFYAFQLDTTTSSSITSVTLQIWDGPPNEPSSNVVFGDTTTNHLIDSYWTGAYRVADENQSGHDISRPIMANTVYVGTFLQPGTYWLDWQTVGSQGNSVFAPSITIAGETTTGNALLFNGTNWINIEDQGTNTQQGIPFALSGCGAALPEWVTITTNSGTINENNSQEIGLTFDSTGYEAGVYTGELCIIRNDAQLPAATVPLTMTVVEPAQVRVAHLAPFATDANTAVDIHLDGTPILTDFTFGESTTYLSVKSGAHSLSLFESGTQNLLRSVDSVQLEPNRFYTVLATGGVNGYDLELLTLEDDISEPAPGTGKVRLTHVAPFAAGLANTAANIRADGTPSILATLQYGETGAGYLVLPANRYDLYVSPSGSEEVFFDIAPFAITANEILDVLVIGDGVNQPLNAFAYPADGLGYLIGEETNSRIYLPLVVTQ